MCVCVCVCFIVAVWGAGPWRVLLNPKSEWHYRLLHVFVFFFVAILVARLWSLTHHFAWILTSNHGTFHPKSFWRSHDFGTLLDGVALVTTTPIFCWKAAKSVYFTCGMARVQSFEQEERLHSSKCCRCLLCHTDREHRNCCIYD